MNTMDNVWQCNNCWAKNSSQATKCKYCGLSIEESSQKDVSDKRKEKLKTTVAIVIIAVVFIAVGYIVWLFYKADSRDYEERLAKDKALDDRGVKTQCELTEYILKKGGVRTVSCKFTANEKDYVSVGTPPSDFKPKYQKDPYNQYKEYLATENFLTVVYDPQNPALNRIDGDRIVSEYSRNWGRIIVALITALIIGAATRFLLREKPYKLEIKEG